VHRGIFSKAEPVRRAGRWWLHQQSRESEPPFGAMWNGEQSGGARQAAVCLANME